MSIWEYRDGIDPDEIEAALSTQTCPFCVAVLDQFTDNEYQEVDALSRDAAMDWLRVHACPVCGWWKAERSVHQTYGPHLQRTLGYGGAASLRAFSPSDISVPIEDVRDFLTVRYGDRFAIHPRVFEETVASVFNDIGYLARETAYSGDGGIDVVMEDSSGQQIGVQVKRQRGAIKVEAIRSLAGALVLGEYTRGVFVTTSTFQRGADSTAKRFLHRGYPIELIDAERFFSDLQIAQRSRYQRCRDVSAPFLNPEALTLISYPEDDLCWPF